MLLINGQSNIFAGLIGTEATFRYRISNTVGGNSTKFMRIYIVHCCDVLANLICQENL